MRMKHGAVGLLLGLLGFVGLLILPPDPPQTQAAIFTTLDGKGGNSTAGVWAVSDKGSVVTIYAQDKELAALAFYKNQNQKNKAADFGISATNTEVNFQVTDKDGKIHFIPVELLIKLKDLPEKQSVNIPQPMPAKPKNDPLHNFTMLEWYELIGSESAWRNPVTGETGFGLTAKEQKDYERLKAEKKKKEAVICQCSDGERCICGPECRCGPTLR